jgi:hypothetical protein
MLTRELSFLFNSIRFESVEGDLAYEAYSRHAHTTALDHQSCLKRRTLTLSNSSEENLDEPSDNSPDS